jgi:predicted outer membrane repeat protein
MPSVTVVASALADVAAAAAAVAAAEIPEVAKPLVGKISGEFSLLSDVSFTRNTATKCGGAFATVVSPSKSRVKVLVPEGLKHTFSNNTAPSAPVWCAMPVYGDDSMAITL